MAVPVLGQEPIKIGYVDVQRVGSSSNAGRIAKEKFQVEVKRVETGLLKKKKELERMKSDIEKKSLLMNELERRNLKRDYQRSVRSYQIKMRDYQEELRERENEIVALVLKDIQQVVVELGRKEKFSFIMQKEQFIYADQTVDLTDRVIKLVNSRTENRVKKKK
jgi:outer membrane protein